MKFSILIAPIALAIIVSQARAMLFEQRTLRELTLEADTVVIGTVLERSSFATPSGVFTDATVAVADYLEPSGWNRYGSAITVRVPGGEINGIPFVADSVANLATGEKVLLFLKETETLGVFFVYGNLFGKYTFGGHRLARHEADAGEVAAVALTVKERAGGVQNPNLKSRLPQLTEPEVWLRQQQSVAAPFAKSINCQCFTASGKKRTSSGSDFTIDSSVPTRFIPAILEAAKTWNQVGAGFQFSLTPNPSSPNVINFAPIGAIATTRNQTDANGFILQTTMTFNSNITTWDTTGRAGTIDIQGVATHEFGHWLNLGDLVAQRCKSATMVAAISDSGKDLRTLSPDDKDGIQYIYGSSKPRVFADLTVTQVSFVPVGIRPPGTIGKVMLAVENSGCAPARLAGDPPMIHHVQVLRVQDTAEMAGVDFMDTVPLPPATSLLPCPGPDCSQRSYLPQAASLFAEPSFLRVSADSTNVVSETDESNNVTASPPF